MYYFRPVKGSKICRDGNLMLYFALSLGLYCEIFQLYFLQVFEYDESE